jgi:hypothetical protein
LNYDQLFQNLAYQGNVILSGANPDSSLRGAPFRMEKSSFPPTQNNPPLPATSEKTANVPV